MIVIDEHNYYTLRKLLLIQNNYSRDNIKQKLMKKKIYIYNFENKFTCKSNIKYYNNDEYLQRKSTNKIY